VTCTECAEVEQRPERSRQGWEKGGAKQSVGRLEHRENSG